MIPDRKFPDGICKCGRKTNIVHCPSCGSMNCEGRKKPRLDAPTDERQDRWWFCKRCYLHFSDTERGKCEAPEYISMSLKRALDKTKQLSTPEAQKISEMSRDEMFQKARELARGLKRSK